MASYKRTLSASFLAAVLLAGACSGAQTAPRASATKSRRTSNDAGEHRSSDGSSEPDAGEADSIAKGRDPSLHEDASGRVRADLYAAALRQVGRMRVDAGAAVAGTAAAPLTWTQIGPQPNSQPEDDYAFPRSGGASVANTAVTQWNGYTVDATLIGASVAGANIPDGTAIASVTSPTSFTLSASGPANVYEQLTIDIPVKDPPMPFSGAVWDIAVSPAGAADTTAYIVGAGGIWKTNDGGATWTPLTDALTAADGSPVTETFSSVALDPVNPSIVYAGTGTYSGSIGGASLGAGVFRSTDGGATWAQTAGSGAMGSNLVARIVVPSSGVVLAATSGGLFRSTDSGAHFTDVAVA